MVQEALVADPGRHLVPDQRGPLTPCLTKPDSSQATSYENTLKTYLRIEDFGGVPDPQRRGTGGRIYSAPPPQPSELALAFLAGCAVNGIPVHEDQNGVMMEGDGGAAIANLIVKDGVRFNMPRAYLWDNLHRENLTVLTGVLAHKLVMQGTRATGVLLEREGELHEVTAAQRVILTAGAIHTPKILMLSGIGRAQDLRPLGIEMVHDLQGVGQNFQDHILAASCNWEYPDSGALPPANNGGEATSFGRRTAVSTGRTSSLSPSRFPITPKSRRRSSERPNSDGRLLPAS